MLMTAVMVVVAFVACGNDTYYEPDLRTVQSEPLIGRNACDSHDDCLDDEACWYEYEAPFGYCRLNEEPTACYYNLPYCTEPPVNRQCVLDSDCLITEYCVGSNPDSLGICQEMPDLSDL